MRKLHKSLKNTMVDTIEAYAVCICICCCGSCPPSNCGGNTGTILNYNYQLKSKARR